MASSLVSVPAPRLSLILCSRNDAYMGNSRWRLETALNYVGECVQALGREADVEVLVSDWGSEVPLRDAVKLMPAAGRIVTFLTVPAPLARSLQGDSPFPEVLALNAAARRARAEYIGRIDQDTLTGEHFLRWFFDMIESGQAEGVPGAPQQALLFANRRSIPYRLAVCCPPYHVIERFIRRFSQRLHIETGQHFFKNDVGVWLAHRDLWDSCGGYDERMIYMNDMEIDMITRLMAMGHPVVNLGRLIGYDFYHLDHYHPGGSRSSSTHRMVNTFVAREPGGLCPSGPGWGLVTHSLDLSSVNATRIRTTGRWPVVEVPVFLLFTGYTRFRLFADRVRYVSYPKWRRRAAIARATVRGQSVLRWPALLKQIWRERPSAPGPR